MSLQFFVFYEYITKYKEQDVPWLNFFINGGDYLLENPLKNNKNKTRILKIKLPIKTNKEECVKSNKQKYQQRKSPPYPAQKCKNKQLKGNDGDTWISKSDKRGIYKWIKLSSNNQTGGIYYDKYIKYKTKYIELKIIK